MWFRASAARTWARKSGASRSRISIPAIATETRDQRVEAVVVHTARHDRQPVAARRHGGGEQLPVADVAGDGDRAAPFRECLVEHLEVAEHVVGIARDPAPQAQLGERLARRARTSPARSAARAAPSSSGKASADVPAARAGAACRGATCAPRPSARPTASGDRRRQRTDGTSPPPRWRAPARRCAARGWRGGSASRASAGASAGSGPPRR